VITIVSNQASPQVEDEYRYEIKQKVTNSLLSANANAKIMYPNRRNVTDVTIL